MTDYFKCTAMVPVGDTCCDCGIKFTADSVVDADRDDGWRCYECPPEQLADNERKRVEERERWLAERNALAKEMTVKQRIDQYRYKDETVCVTATSDEHRHEKLMLMLGYDKNGKLSK